MTKCGMVNGKWKTENGKVEVLRECDYTCRDGACTCITDLLQTQRHPEIVQPLLTLFIVGHHGENRVPKLAGMLRVFQMRQFVNNQIVNDHRLGHDTLPMEVDVVTGRAGCPMRS